MTVSILDLEEAAARGWRAPDEAALARRRLQPSSPYHCRVAPGAS